jgi:hypothetical protein
MAGLLGIKIEFIMNVNISRDRYNSITGRFKNFTVEILLELFGDRACLTHS